MQAIVRLSRLQNDSGNEMTTLTKEKQTVTKEECKLTGSEPMIHLVQLHLLYMHIRRIQVYIKRFSAAPYY